MEDAPGSHSGLMNQLSKEEPVHRLLFLDELINVFNACCDTEEQPPLDALQPLE